MDLHVATTLSFHVCECAACGIKFGLPLKYKENLSQTHKSFYCPNGHSQYYPGETDAEKLQKELRRKEAELSRVVLEKFEERQRAEQAERKLKRVHNGTCPCCKRSFINLQNHIKSKHPELLKK